MIQKRTKAGKNPSNPRFEPQVTRCLVGGTLSSPPEGMDLTSHIILNSYHLAHYKKSYYAATLYCGQLWHLLIVLTEYFTHTGTDI